MHHIDCNCTGMVFIGAESIQHGHHLNCATNTEKVEMAKVTFDGRWCVMEVDDALDMLGDAEADDLYQYQKVYLTQNELDAMPEFAGW